MDQEKTIREIHETVIFIKDHAATREEMKEEIGQLRGGVQQLRSGILDCKQMVILTRLDQERLFTYERIKRIEEDVERIKLQLKMA